MSDNISISATGAAARECPKSFGQFTKLDRWFNGRPLFVNNKGQYLHVSNGGYWFVSSELNEPGICSKGAPLCPGDAKNWTYWDGSKHNPASITIKCGTHNK